MFWKPWAVDAEIKPPQLLQQAKLDNRTLSRDEVDGIGMATGFGSTRGATTGWPIEGLATMGIRTSCRECNWELLRS